MLLNNSIFQLILIFLRVNSLITPNCYLWRQNKRLIEAEKYCSNKRQCLHTLEPCVLFDKIATDYQKHLAELPSLIALSKIQLLVADLSNRSIIDYLDTEDIQFIAQAVTRSKFYSLKIEQIKNQLIPQDQRAFSTLLLKAIQHQI